MCKTREGDRTPRDHPASPIMQREVQRHQLDDNNNNNQLALVKQSSTLSNTSHASTSSTSSSGSHHHQHRSLSLQEHLDGLELGSPSSTTINTIKSIRVTLLCRKADNSVLYMEAGKDFVDLLMSFLTLPIGTVMKLVKENTSSKSTSGGISNIYDSVMDMDESLLYVDKAPLLSPKPVEACELSVDLLKMRYVSHEQTKHVYYKCCNHGCLRFVIDLPGQICPVCKFAMSHKLEHIQPKASYPPSPPTPRRKDKFGYVKRNRTFIVTDSLEILPLSTITSVILLGKLQLDSLKDLESTQLNIGVSEILGLLKASLSSTTALNDVFRSKKN